MRADSPARFELRILSQDLPLELLELRARLEAQLVAERLAGLPIGLERVRLPARGVERAHQLSLQPFA